MTRKVKVDKSVADEAARQEKQRRDAIADFNVNNMGKFWIDPDKIPTEDDIEGAKKEYEDFVKTLQEKKDYLIADKTNALRVAKFMQKFIDNCVWSGMEFVGVLQFHELMQQFIDGFDENNPVDLVFEYGAMEFSYIKFVGRGGIGIESARQAMEENDEYVPICDTLYDLHNWYELQKKKAENIQTKWRMFEQGYYLYVLEGADDDPTETNDADAKCVEETDYKCHGGEQCTDECKGKE